MSGAFGAPGNPVVAESGVLQRQAAFQVASSLATPYLVTPAGNPAGLLLWTAVISSGAFGTPAAAWQATDTITDDNGVTYHGLQIGQAAAAASVAPSESLDLKGILVPAGVGVKLVNGGSGGQAVLRQCNATLIYTQLA